MKTINIIASNQHAPDSMKRSLTCPASRAAGAALLSALILATYSSHTSAVALKNAVGGEVERIVVDDPTDTWSRGTIVVAGQNIIIPRNLIIDLPANRLTLQQLFVNAPAACASDANGDGVPDQTGLAKADSCNGSFTGAAVTILANKTSNGNVIAGEVFLEKATELVSGIVSYINYDEGYFRVDGIAGDTTTGAMVRVNDPEGRFTHQTGAGCLPGNTVNCSADTRYGVDPDNYTFTASTGYPMCIPSTFPRTYDLDLNKNGTLDAGETGLQAVAAADGTGDALCPQTNRGIDPVGDSRLFAPIQVSDHVNAEGNFETVNGVTFLSAHTVGVSVGLTTSEGLVEISPGEIKSFQPDYMIFDEVGWDVPGFQNQRVRDLLIAFGTLGTTNIDVFGLYYDPANNTVHEQVFATTLGCDIASDPGNIPPANTCTTQAIVGNTAVFKIVHDVDFINGAPVDARRSPCQHLTAAATIGGGIPRADGTLITDVSSRCSANPTMGQEFAVLSPPTRDIIGRSRHKHDLHPSVVTLDFHGRESQNGEYLNPVGLGHPEFVEIDLAALQTPYIFAGIPWNLDRRLSPGGGCDGEPTCDQTTPIGDPGMSLDPFPYSGLDPGTQAGAPGVPLVSGYGINQRNRTLSYWPLTGAQIMDWPPADPVGETITPTQHAGLMCTLLSGIDTDADGVDDAIDNCTTVPNGTLLPVGKSAISQRDTDGDGYGNVCDADFNGDGLVTLSDYSQFRGVFGQTAPGVEPYTLSDHADFNGDGLVTLSDYSTFRSLFGKAPGPSAFSPVP